MKGRNILCVSQASTAICMSHMADHIQPSSSPPPSSSSLPSSSSSSAAIHYGGRTIDRHNPIIRDSRRPTLHAPCSSSPRAAVNPTPYRQLIQKNPSSSSTTKKKKSSSADGHNKRKSTSSVPVISPATSIFTSKLLTKQPDRTVTVNKKKEEEDTAKLAELITPPGSTRYLLSETEGVDGSSDLPDPIVELQVPGVEEQKKLAVVVHQDDTNKKQSSALAPKSSSRFKSDQVVVLRVSLHCKGCEGKVRKHISRMEGVTSFNIDFKAKKVTVVGDVTPLSVLASVSKVKTAQLWTSTAPLDAVANNRS